MKMQSTIIAALLTVTACSQAETGSDVMALERSSKILKLKAGADGESEGEHLKFSSVNYTIYETGRVDLHGDVSFMVPLIEVEIDIPFTKTYYTNAANVLSARYKAVTEASLQTDRLALDVIQVTDDQAKARVKGQINRSFHWTDMFWGFDMITLDLDLSGKVVQIDRVELKRSYAYYDAAKQRNLPALNCWEDDSCGDQMTRLIGNASQIGEH